MQSHLNTNMRDYVYKASVITNETKNQRKCFLNVFKEKTFPFSWVFLKFYEQLNEHLHRVVSSFFM